jgi:two-component system sensor histidine kinase KdpD
VKIGNRYRQLYWQRVVVFLTHCVLALAATAVTTGFLYLLRNHLSPSTIALLFLAPVGLAAMLWGLSSGVLAALAAFVALNYFFTQPQFTLVVTRSEDLLALVVFLAVAGGISQLMGRSQASLQEARLRERDVIYLYELMATLASLRNQDAIARTAATRLYEVFQARAVEVILQPDAHKPAEVYRAPAEDGVQSTHPDEVVALITPRGLLGEVHLWHRRILPPVEERLLNTFVSQVALALERVNLAQAETRARVLGESDRLKSALLSSVSHELRTPLATIKAGITSLRSGEVSWNSHAREDLLAAVDEEADHLNWLVGNLLDMSRIEAGALKPQRQWNILADILSGTITRMRRVTETHHLEIDVSDDLPLVPVDHMQIDQVFSKLISNGLKYAPAGTRIKITAHVQKDKEILVEVSNQGPQISEEDLARIFDKFYRVTAVDTVTGTGLGLSICKGIVEAHGGHIWASNLPDGMAFYFTLPLLLDGQRAPLPPSEPE